MLWKSMLSGRGVSNGSSWAVVHSVPLDRVASMYFMRRGRASAPAVTARETGESADSPSRLQN
jgi:hypothetical protein